MIGYVNSMSIMFPFHDQVQKWRHTIAANLRHRKNNIILQEEVVLVMHACMSCNQLTN